MPKEDLVKIWKVCQHCECASLHVCVTPTLTHRGMGRDLGNISFCLASSIVLGSIKHNNNYKLNRKFHVLFGRMDYSSSVQTVFVIHGLTFHLVPV